jgi:hypothetical protein
MKLPIHIINFAANNEDRITGYSKFVEYFNLYKSGKTQSEAGISFSEMDNKMLEFFKDELKLLSGKDPSL